MSLYFLQQISYLVISKCVHLPFVTQHHSVIAASRDVHAVAGQPDQCRTATWKEVTDSQLAVRVTAERHDFTTLQQQHRMMQSTGYLCDGSLSGQVHRRRRERRHAAGISLHIAASSLLLNWITEVRGER
jgi:hypothetical protein